MFRPVIALTTGAGLLLAAAAVPAGAANREHQQMMADIRMLQEQTQQLQLMLGVLSEALKTVTAKLDDQAGGTRKAFADQKLLVDNVAGDLRVVREKVDETNVRITSLSQEMEALRLAIPPPAPASPALPGESPAPGAPPSPTPTAPPTPAAAVGMTPQRLYETAWADYAGGQWTIAIEGFETYIRTFPRSEMADDAQWYIGESYQHDGKFRDAIAAYDKVIANYPSGNRIPDAYYKRGVVYEGLRELDRARESWEFVVKNYRDSAAGGLARQALDRLNRTGR